MCATDIIAGGRASVCECCSVRGASYSVPLLGICPGPDDRRPPFTKLLVLDRRAPIPSPISRRRRRRQTTNLRRSRETCFDDTPPVVLY